MGKKTSKNKVKKNSKNRIYYKLLRVKRRGLDIDQLQDDIQYITRASAATNSTINTDDAIANDDENGSKSTMDVEESESNSKTTTLNIDPSLIKSLPSSRFNGRLIREEVANNGESYCLQCGRYFINEKTLLVHQRSKLHKKKLVLYTYSFSLSFFISLTLSESLTISNVKRSN
jgi:hypothetical protein